MGSEHLWSSIIPFAGSGLGYAMGFALKKVLKWMLIIIGFLAGMFFVGVQLLEKYGYVSAGLTTLNGVVFRKYFRFQGINEPYQLYLGYLLLAILSCVCIPFSHVLVSSQR
jgi:uncharacterized membrane protein (Fun14 family)